MCEICPSRPVHTFPSLQLPCLGAREVRAAGPAAAAQRGGRSERSIWAAKCPSQPANSFPAPIQAPEHMVLLAPHALSHFGLKPKFQLQAKNIRSRGREEQQTSDLLFGFVADLCRCRDGMTLVSVQGPNHSINSCKAQLCSCFCPEAAAPGLQNLPGA